MKVLVIRFSSLGDIVLSTAAMEVLRSAGCRVTVVTKNSFADLLENTPDIAIYRYGSGREKEEREKFFRWFEGQEFSFVLDLHDSWRSWFWRRRLKRHCPVYVAKKERFREWGILWFKLKFFSFGPGGRALKFHKAAQDALRSHGHMVPGQEKATQLYLTQAEREAAQKYCPAEDFIVFLPGGAWKGKEWPYFKELASVVAKKAPILILGGKKDYQCEEIGVEAKKWNSQSCSLHGKTNLRESMAILAKAKWIIGNDTGMIHVAEALGKDVAVLEGPTHESMGFSPYRKNSLLIGLPLFCRPCSKTGKICLRFGSRKCLKALSVSDVLLKLRFKGYPC